MKFQFGNTDSRHRKSRQETDIKFYILGLVFIFLSGIYWHSASSGSHDEINPSDKAGVVLENIDRHDFCHHPFFPILPAVEDTDDRENKEDEVFNHGAKFNGISPLDGVFAKKYYIIPFRPTFSSGKILPLYVIYHSWKNHLSPF